MNRFFINEKKVWTFSLTLSVIMNIFILAAISIYWLSMKYEPQPKEELITIQLLEIPAPRKPVTTIPQKEKRGECNQKQNDFSSLSANFDSQHPLCRIH